MQEQAQAQAQVQVQVQVQVQASDSPAGGRPLTWLLWPLYETADLAHNGIQALRRWDIAMQRVVRQAPSWAPMATVVSLIVAYVLIVALLPPSVVASMSRVGAFRRWAASSVWVRSVADAGAASMRGLGSWVGHLLAFTLRLVLAPIVLGSEPQNARALLIMTCVPAAIVAMGWPAAQATLGRARSPGDAQARAVLVATITSALLAASAMALAALWPSGADWLLAGIPVFLRLPMLLGTVVGAGVLAATFHGAGEGRAASARHGEVSLAWSHTRLTFLCGLAVTVFVLSVHVTHQYAAADLGLQTALFEDAA